MTIAAVTALFQVTVPFDADYTESKVKLVCTCMADEGEVNKALNCKILNFNRNLDEIERLLSVSMFH